MTGRVVYKPLGKRERRFLSEYIAGLVPTAADKRHPMRKVALHLMSMAMWRWTADGVVADTPVKRDALKYDYEQQPCTNGARLLLKQKLPGARHEHVVPRMFMAQHIADESMSAAQVHRLLGRYCRATIIAKKEDSKLLPRNKMPDGWSWKNGDPYARYPAWLRKRLRV